MLDKYFAECPLVAILRGVAPEEVVAVADILFDAGFRIIEVPLNSPQPLESITRLSQSYGQNALIGAGTVTTVDEVNAVSDAGGQLIFSPNCNPEVIRATKKLNMVSMPGCCTPSEAFAAIEAGADALKFFPANIVTPSALQAMKAVLPTIPSLAVGGITNDNMAVYLQAGVNGFGIGSSLYKADKSLSEVRESAIEILAAFRHASEQVN